MCFVLGLVCLLGLLQCTGPLSIPVCVCAALFVGCLWSWGWAGCTGEQVQSVLGAGSSILLTPWSRDCALMLPSRVWTHTLVSIAGECCHSLKGKNAKPKTPPQTRKVWEGYGKSIAVCNGKETSERTGQRTSQGEVVRTSQQCGHKLDCQVGFSWCAHEKWCSHSSTGSVGMLLGLPLNTRSCWIVHWTYKKPPCQVTAETQSKSVCSVFCWYRQEGQVYSVMALF